MHIVDLQLRGQRRLALALLMVIHSVTELCTFSIAFTVITRIPIDLQMVFGNIWQYLCFIFTWKTPMLHTFSPSMTIALASVHIHVWIYKNVFFFSKGT